MRQTLAWILAGVAACAAYAVETRLWKQSEAADFEKGKLERLALSSNGELSLAPEWRRVADLETPLVWSLLAAPGGLRRPSDGAAPREVVFVQCAGSRDPDHGVPYCSKVCCMTTAKQAMLVQRMPGAQAYVFYIDIRSPGKGYDEFVQQAMTNGVLYLRGKVSRLFAEDGKVMVWGADTGAVWRSPPTWWCWQRP